MGLFHNEPGPAADGTPPTPQAAADELAALSVEMEQGKDSARRQGVRRASALVASAARALGQGGAATAKGVGIGGRALAERLLQTAPRIPIRDLPTLRAQYPDATDPEALADLLTAGARRASAAIGAGVGAAAMLPVPPAMTVELAAEALLVAAVEIKLVAELHHVYGVPAHGSAPQRTVAYVTAWANRRGIDGQALTHPSGVAAVAGLAVGSEVRSKIRRRLAGATLRRLPSLTPLLAGAGLGAMLNRRDTAKLATQIRADLRTRNNVTPGYWAAAAPR